MSQLIRVWLTALASFFLLALPLTVQARYDAPMPSVSSQGTAGAGAVSSAEDASSQYFNPALMTKLDPDSQHITTGFTLEYSQYDFDTESATDWAGGELDPTDVRDDQVLINPFIYYATSLQDLVPYGDRIFVGLGVTVPYQVQRDLSDDDPTRYAATGEEITAIDINPSFAVKITDWMSFGAGMSVQYVNSQYSNMVDMASIIEHACTPAFPGGPVTPGCDNLPDDINQDVEVVSEADNWGVGFNLGLTFDLTEDLLLGVAYRFGVRHDLSGTTKSGFSHTPGNEIINSIADSPFTYDFDEPDTYSIGLTYQINPAWQVMANFDYMTWGHLQNFAPNIDRGSDDDNDHVPVFDTSMHDLDDTIRVAVGATYLATPKLLLRAGVAFDQSPFSDDTRTIIHSETDRYEVAVGFRYLFNERISMDMAYTHAFMTDGDINMATEPVGDGDDENNYTLVGSTRQSSDFIALQVNAKIW